MSSTSAFLAALVQASLAASTLWAAWRMKPRTRGESFLRFFIAPFGFALAAGWSRFGISIEAVGFAIGGGIPAGFVLGLVGYLAFTPAQISEKNQ